jgi:hypothetical protein
MNSIIWGAVIVLVVLIIAFFCTISPFDTNLKTWCETRKHVSDNKKEVELRRLEVLEKAPELRQLIFHPKTLEKEEKT